MFIKTTHGCVVQSFDDNGKCIKQFFWAGNTIEYEDEKGEYIQPPDNEQYCPFDMVQPLFRDTKC